MKSYSCIAFGVVVLYLLNGCAVVPPKEAAQNVPKLNTVNPLQAGFSNVVDVGFLSEKSPFSCNGDITYIPLPAIDVPNYSKNTLVNGVPTQSPDSWPDKTDDVNNLLPNIAMQVVMGDANAAVSVDSIAGVKASHKHILIDFTKYRTEPIKDGNDNTLAYSRIGAGLRVDIKFDTVDANIGSGLFALAASAKAGKTLGTVSAEIIGMNSNDATVSMPFTLDLSDASIQKVIEAMAIVRTKLTDEKTKLKPQYIARLSCTQPAAQVAQKAN
ncbi:hypothetical protein [Andreprevotia chitinilytica]|uniref:hypothetical protein n=1 Tax=Andreprevotia chitinilytica TaxID=396808 RepID=UPI0012EC4857|nr:hypothetical protein [Andreprevotia chitinilytica]